MAADDALNVEIEAGEKAYLIRIQGSLGALEAVFFFLPFNSVAAHRPGRVVVDLSKVTFLSSLGMGALVGLHRSLRHFSGVVCLVGPTEMVREALQRARLHETMPIFDDVTAALA